jgi:pyruvate,water dikinase
VSEILVGAEEKAADRESSYRRTLRSMLDYITPLHLLDPSAPEFRPQSCRSLHDIIRYCHEKAVQIMFGLGGISGNTATHCRKLATDLPLDIYLLDVGGAFAGNQSDAISPQTLHAAPFLALWQGLSHPGVDWHNHLHFDWKGFSDMTMSGGVSLGVSKEFASYAVVSPDYLNLNMRFGFHFALLDCLCGAASRANYCQLRFAGGGGDYQGKVVRITLLQRILERLDFEVRIRGDLLDARLMGLPAMALTVVLIQVGRLLGVTKLLDMTLRTEDVDSFVEQFFQERTSGSDQ